jgi:hypothetical protein
MTAALALIVGAVSLAFWGLSAHAMTLDDPQGVAFAQDGPWWAASPAQIAAAPCRHTIPMSDSELTRALNDLTDSMGQTVSRTLRGIRFQNESPLLLDLFDRLTAYRPQLLDAPKPQQYSSANPHEHRFQSHCTKVICAAQQIFGERQGLQLLYLLARYGYNGSHLAFAGARAWTVEELDDLLIALADYPATALPIAKDQQLIHLAPPAERDRCYKVVANATIAVTYLWDDHPHEEKQSTLFHEVAHGFGITGADTSNEWRSFSAWTESDSPEEVLPLSADSCPRQVPVSKYQLGKPESVVSDYGKANPFEDFAESAVAYRYNPDKLKSLSPGKYEFMKEIIFDGLEYTSEQACDPANSYTEKMFEGRIRHELDHGVGDDVIEAVYRKCEAEIHGMLAFGRVPEALDPASRQCVSHELVTVLASRIAKAQEFHYAQYALRSLETRNIRPASDAAVQDAAKRIRRRLHDEIVAAVLDQDRSMHYRYSDFDSPPPQQFCAEWSRYPSSSEQARIRDVLTAICVKVQGRYDRRQPMKKRHVKSAVDSYF